MSGEEIQFSLSNYNAITSHQTNLSSLQGIFSFLYDLNGNYGSRYEFIGNSRRDEVSLSNLDQHFTKGITEIYISEDNTYQFKIKFNSLFFLTGYSLLNTIKDNSNTHPISWKIYGIENDEQHLLDTQKDQAFCSTSFTSG